MTKSVQPFATTDSYFPSSLLLCHHTVDFLLRQAFQSLKKVVDLHLLGERDDVTLVQISNTFGVDFHRSAAFDGFSGRSEVSSVRLGLLDETLKKRFLHRWFRNEGIQLRRVGI